jgi:chemotaxis protein methyltransferase CheR
VWSAACSIGAEPYSLAMLLLERCPPGSTVWATDIDTTVLAKARRGIYRESELRGVSAERRRRYFEEVADGYAVKPELKAIVRFQVHDLLRDRFPAPWDLIVCRNVVIYFTEEARRNLYRRFATVLRPGGVLFVGATETILYAGEVGLRPLSPSFYRKAATETDVRTDRRGGHAHGQGVGG